MVYRVYMADSLYYYAHGRASAQRYSEILKHRAAPKDDRSGDEIVTDLVGKMGLKVV